MEHSRKSLVLVIFFIVLLAVFFLFRMQLPQTTDYGRPVPVDVVRLYFTAWNAGNYPDMYSTLSDGFKKLEPTAKNLAAFLAYVDAQPVSGVEILNLRETSNDGDTAQVEYDVVFITADEEKIPYRGTFTLRYRQGDIIQGWKLIHPYGDTIDAS